MSNRDGSAWGDPLLPNFDIPQEPNCPLVTGLRPCMCDLHRCPVCNYTKHDAQFEMDHDRCRGTIPGQRVRVLGDLYHGVVPDGAVYIGRGAPGLKQSPYRNPFRAKDHGENALHLFARYLDGNSELVARARKELAGKDLACWCRIGAACHGDEWLRRLAVPGPVQEVPCG